MDQIPVMLGKKAVGSLATSAVASAVTRPDAGEIEKLTVQLASQSVVSNVSDIAERLRNAKEQADLEGVSILKHDAFLAEVANFLFKADALKGLIGWTRARDPSAFAMDIPKYKLHIEMLAKQMSLPPTVDEENLVSQIYQIATTKESNVSLGKRQSGEFPAVDRMFNELSAWGYSGPLPKRKTGKPIKALQLSDICLMVTCNETFDEHIVSTRGKSDEKKALQDGVTKTDVLRKLKELQEKQKPDAKTVDGIVVTQAYQEAIERATSMDEATLRSLGETFETTIPPGTQLVYEFFGGGGHHAVYIGSYAVVEVKNVDAGLGKGVTGYVTITHIHDFMKRARNGASAIYRIEYDNPLPIDLIQQRALWTVGTFPNYHIANENCESVASWVTSNEYSSAMCVINYGGRHKTYRKRHGKKNRV